MDLPHGETGLAAFERTSAVGEIYCAGDLLSAQGRAPVQPVLSTAAGAKRVSVGVRRWENFRGLSQARRWTLAADDRPARLDH
jgi:hypothetical protein